MKYSERRFYPVKIKKKEISRFVKMTKTDMLMRVAQKYPEMVKGYIKFTNGEENGRHYIDLNVVMIDC